MAVKLNGIKPDNKGKKPKAKRTFWRRAATSLAILVDIPVGIGLLISAYGGMVNPTRLPLLSVATISFPLWILAAIVMLILTFWAKKKAALLPAAAIAIALPAILNFSPFHISRHAGKDQKSITLMSYNVYGFTDQSGKYPGGVNPTISSILATDADVVCLQEVYTLSASESLHITNAQIDSLHRRYPYIYIGSQTCTILSKIPVKPVNLGLKNSPGSSDIACFRLDIDGKVINIFDIHLQSFELSNADRDNYLKLTGLKAKESQIDDMGKQLIRKISRAAPLRAADTQQLLRYIKKYGGPNVIICGDFNDVPGSYPIRLLRRDGFHEVYPEVGFGPMITYNAKRFFFRIDHILYRGDLEAVSMKRGHNKSSDHYPIIATFAIK